MDEGLFIVHYVPCCIFLVEGEFTDGGFISRNVLLWQMLCLL